MKSNLSSIKEAGVHARKIAGAIFRFLLILGGGILLALLSNHTPADAAEVKVSYNGVLLVVGQCTVEDLAAFDVEKTGKRTYNLYKDDVVVASVKFDKNKILKKIVIDDNFLDGLLAKDNAPRFSHFGDDLEEKGIADCNTLLTGSRTPDYSEMSFKKSGMKVSWNYDLTRENGYLEGTLKSCMYHEGKWYVLITY